MTWLDPTRPERPSHATSIVVLGVVCVAMHETHWSGIVAQLLICAWRVPAGWCVSVTDTRDPSMMPLATGSGDTLAAAEAIAEKKLRDRRDRYVDALDALSPPRAA
ncbi:hypothetical protein [Sandaracinus amylolyticus]|uniref:Uncharacterized protein n=1 Tax=Sandaracinus amylolyticus TaxID=927083 RepID=A0A0F6YHV4_9BACT|nr:hypothetical protein [Sandaracinus amylolyticus]AKF06053.1 hypothetical protein DB32_003202 [Sandaracinus amylolyticus]